MSGEPWEKDYDPPDRLTELEQAVVDWALEQFPALRNENNRALKVVRRDYTVHGWFIDFDFDNPDGIKPKIDSNGASSFMIRSPGISHGGGAVLYTVGDCLQGIEMFSYGGHFADDLTEFRLE